MTQAPTLTDGVVTLRAHRDDDADGVLEQCTDLQTLRWTTVPSPYSRSDALDFIRHFLVGNWREDLSWGFAVEHQGRYCGTVELRNSGPGRAEVAYAAHPAARGTGVMERALRLLLTWGFEQRDLQSVVWWANRGNFASWRLAWKVGFTWTGPVKRWLTQRELGPDGSPGTAMADDLVDGWEAFLLRGQPLEPAHPWLNAPRIVGETITLRERRESDSARMVEACSDAETVRWLGGIPSPYTEEMARDFLIDRGVDMARGQSVFWSVADADDVQVAAINLLDLDRTLGRAEIGYWVHPAARGRGVAVEATRLVARHAFLDESDGGLGLRQLYASVADGNEASAAVLRAAGFTLVGHEENLCFTRSGPTRGTRWQLTR